MVYFRQRGYLSDGSSRGSIPSQSRTSPRCSVLSHLQPPLSLLRVLSGPFIVPTSCLRLRLLLHSFILHFYSSSDEPQPQSEITLLIEASLSIKTVSRGGRERSVCMCVRGSEKERVCVCDRQEKESNREQLGDEEERSCVCDRRTEEPAGCE